MWVFFIRGTWKESHSSLDVITLKSSSDFHRTLPLNRVVYYNSSSPQELRAPHPTTMSFVRNICRPGLKGRKNRITTSLSISFFEKCQEMVCQIVSQHANKCCFCDANGLLVSCCLLVPLALL